MLYLYLNQIVMLLWTYYSESFVLVGRSWAYRTVPMFIPDIYQNGRNEKLNQKKFSYDHAHGHAPRTKLSLYMLFKLLNYFKKRCMSLIMPCIGTYLGNYIVILYLILKFLYITNTILQVFLVSGLLGN